MERKSRREWDAKESGDVREESDIDAMEMETCLKCSLSLRFRFCFALTGMLCGLLLCMAMPL